jgi:hypothetical protein
MQVQSGKVTNIKNQKKGKNAAAIGEGSGSVKENDTAKAKDGYLAVVCFNCGEPGHNKSMCSVAPFCFICKKLNHKEDNCPIRKLPPPMAQVYGSAVPGLEFFHIECSDSAGEEKNVGIVYIEAGEISKEELKREFAIIYKTNWPWQFREMEPWSYLVKFPPHLLVEDVASYPCFGLMKEGVTVNVEVWDGEFHSEEENSEVWVQLRGLKPQWCTWDTLARFTSSFGILTDIDWQGMFLNYYEVLRVKLQCRDPTLIPAKWLFEVKKKYHKILLQVEPPVVIDVEATDGPDGPDHDITFAVAKKADNMDTEANSSFS